MEGDSLENCIRTRQVRWRPSHTVHTSHQSSHITHSKAHTGTAHILVCCIVFVLMCSVCVCCVDAVCAVMCMLYIGVCSESVWMLCV